MGDMDEQCPKCHVSIRTTDYYCYNCGKNLKSAPASLSVVTQLGLYAKSILIPPFGVLWAIKYLKQNNKKAKLVGMVAIILTLTSFVISVVWLRGLVSRFNDQLNKQLNYLSY